MGLDGLGRGTVPPSCRVDVPHVWWREPRSRHVSFLSLVDEQDVEFVDFVVDDLSALVDHDIPLYLVILSSIIAHSVG